MSKLIIPPANQPTQLRPLRNKFTIGLVAVIAPLALLFLYKSVYILWKCAASLLSLGAKGEHGMLLICHWVANRSTLEPFGSQFATRWQISTPEAPNLPLSGKSIMCIHPFPLQSCADPRFYCRDVYAFIWDIALRNCSILLDSSSADPRQREEGRGGYTWWICHSMVNCVLRGAYLPLSGKLRPRGPQSACICHSVANWQHSVLPFRPQT